MKKLSFLIFIVFALLTTSSFAQIKKGATFLGGDISSSAQKTTSGANTNKQKSFYVSPVFGKAIKENLVFGGTISVNFFNNKTISSDYTETKQHSYGAGIFMRKYKPIGKGGFFLFVQGNLGYSYFDSKLNTLTSGSTNDKRNTISITVVPGVSYTITKKLQLEAGLTDLLSFQYFTEKQEMTDIVSASYKTNGFNISSSIDGASSIYVGFRVLLN